MADPLVSTDWLAERLGAPGLAVLDATWFMPGSGRDARAEYLQAHIPGAVFFDIDAVADRSSALPHMLPSADDFAAAVAAMGIGDDTTVVAYDANGLMASARVWWSLRAMGHDRVFVLDGGLARWREQDRPVATGEETPVTSAPFTPRFAPELVRTFDQVHAQTAAVVDARPAPRFLGEAPEPRPGLRSGHMPGAKNLPHGRLLTPAGRLKPAGELAPLFAEAGVDIEAPIVTSCGSGVTAAILALALARLGRWDVPVYDGSWTEWGGRDDAPVVTGR